MSGRMLVVVNARSGRLHPDQKRQELSDALSRHGLNAEIRMVRGGPHVSNAVADGLRQGFKTITVGGGDGTLSAAAARLSGSGRCMGILPMGTFNYFARSLGIPTDLEKAVGVLAQGNTQRVRMGEVNGKAFLNNASLGVYGRILEQREVLYQRWGRSQIAAHLSVLLSLVRPRAPLTLRVTVDGTTHRAQSPMVFVANNAFQLTEFKLAGAECLRRGQLVLYVAPECGRLALLTLAVGLALGRLRPARDFQMLCGTDVLVETRRRHRLVVRDGERERLVGPYRFRLHQDVLHVLAPPAGGAG